MKQKMTSKLRTDVTFVNFLGDFGENLSNSIRTPAFVMIEQQTTKLEGGGGGGHTFPFINLSVKMIQQLQRHINYKLLG